MTASCILLRMMCAIIRQTFIELSSTHLMPNIIHQRWPSNVDKHTVIPHICPSALTPLILHHLIRAAHCFLNESISCHLWLHSDELISKTKLHFATPHFKVADPSLSFTTLIGNAVVAINRTTYKSTFTHCGFSLLANWAILSIHPYAW